MRHRDARSRRGFRRDEAATLAARFEDYRSFVSQPKRIPNGCPNEVHLVLYGFEDKAPIRAAIFRRNREKHHLAGMSINRCEECGHRVFEGDEWPSRRGEWDHVRNGSGERCDCPENGRVLCQECHRHRHPQVNFRRTAQE